MNEIIIEAHGLKRYYECGRETVGACSGWVVTGGEGDQVDGGYGGVRLDRVDHAAGGWLRRAWCSCSWIFRGSLSGMACFINAPGRGDQQGKLI